MSQLSQIRQMANFFTKFEIIHNDHETKIVKNLSGLSYLIKNIQLPSQNTNMDNIIETLQQHLTLNKQYMLTLLHYDILPQKDDEIINVRAIYQYANLTLKEEIQQRRQNLEYFKLEQIWSLIYTVTKSLEYLEKFNIGYGVLGCDKIFIEQKIKLLDPSAVAEDPMLIRKDRLYSPQILLGYQGIDILKSDIYVFGLCIIEATLLINFSCQLNQTKYDETKIKIYLQQVQNMYGHQLSGLLSQMLKFHIQQRPNFSQLREYLQKMLYMKSTEIEYQTYICESHKDFQDEPNNCQIMNQLTQFENEDVEQQEDNDQSNSSSMSQYEKAKIKYLNYSKINGIYDKSLSPIYENSMNNSSMSLLTSSRMGEKKKVSKAIKERLVKNTDFEIIDHKQYHNRNDEIFTNPQLMQDIKANLRSIARHRNQLSSKQNIYHFNN